MRREISFCPVYDNSSEANKCRPEILALLETGRERNNSFSFRRTQCNLPQICIIPIPQFQEAWYTTQRRSSDIVE